MLWRSHLVMGVAAGYLVAGWNPAMLLAAGVASLLPDLDHPRSYIGNKVPVAPTITRMVLGHRGGLHSLIAALGVGLVANLIWGTSVGMVVAVGYIAHLIGDMLTPSGVPLFWPLKVSVKIPLFKTGGVLERLVVYPLLLVGLGFLMIWPEVEDIVWRVVGWLR